MRFDYRYRIHTCLCFNINHQTDKSMSSFYKPLRSLSSVLALTLLLLISSTSKPLDSSKVVVAINCGSKTEAVLPSQGNFRYVPDDKFVSGKSVDVDYHNDNNAVDAEIKYTFDKELYMFERHTYQQMFYDLPVKPGKNTLILKFAEMYFKSKGQRTFNIKIGDTVVREEFDVIANSGAKYAAHEEFIEIDVKSDGVYYAGKRVSRGMENHKLKLSFAKGRHDNPIIQGIIVYHDTIDNSPKDYFQGLKKKWNSQQEMQKAKREENQLKELMLIQKKKEKIVIRNDQLLVEEEPNEKQITKSNQGPTPKFGTIRSLLMGPVGIVIWTCLFGYASLFAYKKVFKMSIDRKIASE